MNLYGILLAGGSGTRLAEATAGVAKQFLPVQGKPMYLYAARTMAAVARLRGLVLVTPPDCQERCAREARAASLPVPWTLAASGARRQDSVRNGLKALAALDPHCDTVLVHDAARPFASPALMNRVADALENGAVAVVPGVCVPDTIKELHGDLVARTLDRARLRAAQTPQGFRTPLLAAAHAAALEQNWSVTDDAGLMELCGHPVLMVEGERTNVKITTPEDLSLISPPSYPASYPRCSGWGYDVHRYGPGRPMKLGGVPIPGAPEVIAHSDGDALLHALMDAILGCLGAGDIGVLFPDTDPTLAGIESGVLLAEVLDMALKAGMRLVHADCTLVAQVPKIGPHREHIRKNLSRLLSLPAHAVNVKATTEEHLGFTGEKKGIKAVALVTMENRNQGTEL